MRNLFLIALLSFGLYSCSNEEVDPQITTLDGQVANRIGDDPCETTFDLIAGQNFTAGFVRVTNDLTNVYVEYQTTGGWQLDEVHLYVGTLANMPKTNNGTPIPGQFLYNAIELYQNYYKFTVPRSSIVLRTDGCFDIVAHAAVSIEENGVTTQAETAWSKGPRINNKTWAMYSTACFKPACDEGCTTKTETAYGGSTAGAGKAWWFAYDSSVGGTQPIYAGKHLVGGGSVEVVNGVLTIVLPDNVDLDPDEDEAVKVQGYDVLPLVRPASGQFITYKGIETNLIQVGTHAYYVIHLDVVIETCTPTTPTE